MDEITKSQEMDLEKEDETAQDSSEKPGQPETIESGQDQEAEDEIDRSLIDLMTVEEIIEENGKLMVEFEAQMFKDLCYSDALVVCGR
jgi:hypothetical protein